MLDSMEGIWTHDVLKPAEWRGEGGAQFVEAKRDGWRVTAFMQEDPTNGLCIFSRKREAHLEMSLRVDWMPEFKKLERFLPPLSSVDGELWAPGLPASAVPTAMNARGSIELRFSPFALPWWEGKWFSGRMGDARHKLEHDLGLEPVPQLPFMHDTREACLDAARFFDAEGIVLKEDHYRGWYKVKEEYTLDCVLTAIKPGDEYGKYSHTTGSLHGSVYRTDEGLVEIACVSGMDDELREAVSVKDLGRVFEVKAQYLAAGGRLRHPRFLRWRDDKDARDCTWDQVEAMRSVKR